MTCLLVDIGNTTTAVALGGNGRVRRVRRVRTRPRGGEAIRRLLDKIASARHVAGAVFCSVVPALNRDWLAALRRRTGVPPINVNHRLRLDVTVAYPRPKTVGADRLANACGAVGRYGAPVIVADFGTALTFDVVAADRKYVGGVIAPGLPLMTDYLAEKTALLPRILLRGVPAAVGRSTEGAMRIGARVGYRGMVREITEHVRRSMRMPDAKLCATGGYAEWVLRGLDIPFRLDPDLTLYGLWRIYELNAPANVRDARRR